MFVLRKYQQDAVDALFLYFENNNSGNVILSLPTASGKSVIQAAFINETLKRWPTERFLLVSHVKELLIQNQSKLQALGIESEIYSAGLGSKKIGQVTVAGIQSIYKKADKVGDISIVMVDECFVSGTKISTPKGQIDIDKVRCGDIVFNANGTGVVLGKSARPTNEIYRLEFDDGSKIECTGNHEFFTEKGWTQARFLEKRKICFSEEGMRLLQKRMLSMEKNTRKWKRKINAGIDMDEAKILFDILFEKSIKSHEQQSSKNKNERNIKKNKTQTNQKRWKWEAPADSTISVTSCPGRRMGVRVTSSNSIRIGEYISNSLQDRYSKQGEKNSNRDRWWKSLFHREKGTGSKKDRSSYFPRLVSISCIESKSTRAVFNLHVSGHPSYFANGKLVHNCHLISKDNETMYRKFINDLTKHCPHIRVIGMSATPFRLDSGPLINGDNRLFTDIAYSISIKELINQGYLAGLITAPIDDRVDSSEVKKRGGEYISGDLERFMDNADITKAAIDDVESLCSDRKSWLVFCVGVNHAMNVTAEIKSRGISCALVVGKTPAKERQETLDKFKSGELRALVSVGVLTTGFDAPCVDALICLRPTLSPGLWIQIIGRITRPYPGKVNGIVCDFTDNTERHGPIDEIYIDGDGNIKEARCGICEFCGGLILPSKIVCNNCGREKQKTCPECKEKVNVSENVCITCGYDFVNHISTRKPKHNTTASTASIISGDSPYIYKVDRWQLTRHRKVDKPDSVRVRYYCGLKHFDQWLCFDHGGYASTKAYCWSLDHGAASNSTNDALNKCNLFKMPEEIKVKKEGQYWRVV